MSDKDLTVTNNPTAAAESVPAPAPRLSEILLPLIAVDGPLDQRLKEIAKQQLKPKARNLLEGIVRGLEKMRGGQQYGHNWFYLPHPPDKEKLCRCMLTWSGDSFRIDPVLQHALLRRVGLLERDEELRERALERYQQAAPEFDLILGDLIPEDIKRDGHVAYASYAYDRGINATALQDWDEYGKRRIARTKEPLRGLATGVAPVDANLRGLRGAVYLAGRPGVGKTSLAMAFAIGALRHNKDTALLWYSLDNMAKTTIYDRLLCNESNLDYLTVTSPVAAEEALKSIAEAEARLRAEILPRLCIKHRLIDPTAEMPLANIIVADMDETRAAAGVSTVLTVIDYFQLLPTPNPEGQFLEKDNYRVQTIQQLLRWSSDTAFPMGWPILVISELRKGDSSAGEAGITDLLGSNRLGYSAEAVMILEAQEEDQQDIVPVDLRIVKGRDGVIRGRIPLLFEHTKSRFREAAAKSSNARKQRKAPTPQRSGIDPLGGKE